MVQDLLGGQIQIAFASALQVKPHIEAGKLKAIGVSGERRMGTLPNVPSLAEQGLNDEAYRVAGWLAFGAPAGTPAPSWSALPTRCARPRSCPMWPSVLRPWVLMCRTARPRSSPPRLPKSGRCGSA